MAVLLLHGLGSDSARTLALLGPALPAGERVFAPDLRAHGDSTQIGSARDFSIADMTQGLVERIRSENFDAEPLTVIGISLGAALALQLAKLGTLPIECLVLLRPAFTDAALPRNLAVFPVIGELLHRHGTEWAEREFRRSGLYRTIQRESALGGAGTLEQFREPDAQQRAIRLIELPRNRAFAPGETLALAPATIIAAPRDPVHPLAVAELWHRTLTDSTLVMVPARDDGLAAYVAAIRDAVRSALG